MNLKFINEKIEYKAINEKIDSLAKELEAMRATTKQINETIETPDPAIEKIEAIVSKLGVTKHIAARIYKMVEDARDDGIEEGYEEGYAAKENEHPV